MNRTVLVCANGWSAVYDTDGKRVETHGPEEQDVLMRLQRSGLTVEARTVPVDKAFQDFPDHL